MEGVMRDIATGFEVEITAFNGESDHIHLLIYHRPKGRCFTRWMVNYYLGEQLDLNFN
ncbi:transposase [Marinomonas sp. 2405UD68-3]|uniref:transposase n=1 Tax=Marinomonas sp. 2405UD68-3 TaxID=3391835 RepID=UPI0039C9FB89